MKESASLSSSTTTTTTTTASAISNTSSVDPTRILNINIGVLGHVDSGKTSLVKTLSTLLSTASLDKSSQSRQRGITLDLGFSAFLLPLPDQFRKKNNNDNDGNDDDDNDDNDNDNDEYYDYEKDYDYIQITLVDCPGHASLIRTIIGGAQIIDMILLVVDATKGIQTQTKECLVIAEMTTRDLIVVLNKIDLLKSSSSSSNSTAANTSINNDDNNNVNGFNNQENNDNNNDSDFQSKLQVMKKKVRKTLSCTVFHDAPLVEISAAVGGEKVAALQSVLPTTNIDQLITLIQSKIRPPTYRKNHSSPDEFNFSIDHCFPIKGKGTIITGTVLSGSTKINNIIEFPTLGSMQRKIKSIQMFRRNTTQIQIGDRAGICISNFDSNLLERGIACSPGTVQHFQSAIVLCRKVRFFKGSLLCDSKYHISVGHTTIMATATFFGAKELDRITSTNNTTNANHQEDYEDFSFGQHADVAGLPRLSFDYNQDFIQQKKIIESIDNNSDSNNNDASSVGSSSIASYKQQPSLNWAVLHFQVPIFCPLNSLIIGSRLDTDIQSNTCRLAFSGRIIQSFDPKKDMNRIRIYNWKEKTGLVNRLGDAYVRKSDSKTIRFEIYGADLFKKESNMTPFIGMILHTSTSNELGYIHSSFGTGGKFKVHFPMGTTAKKGDKLFLRFKRFVNDASKKMIQDPYAFPSSRVDATIIEIVPKSKKKNKQQQQNNNIESNNNASATPKVEANGEITNLKPDPNNPNSNTSTIAIITGFFKQEDNITTHKGKKVLLHKTNAIKGKVVGPFGKAGKCKVLLEDISMENEECSIGDKVCLLSE